MIQFAGLFKDCLSRFRETPEFGVLNKHSAGVESMSAQDRRAIIDSVESTFAPLFDQIKADTSSLTDSDLVFCVLSNMGIGASTIADCLTISPHTVRVRKHRLREKLPASWYDVFYGEDDNEEPVDEVSHKPGLPFVREISKCFRNYFNTNGRADRFEYMCFFFFWLIVTYTNNILDDKLYRLTYMVNQQPTDGFFTVLLHVVSWIIMMGFMPPLYTVTVRRLHDLNCSGWLAIIFCGLSCAIVIGITFVNTFYGEVFYIRERFSDEFGYYVLVPLYYSRFVLYGMLFFQVIIFSIKGTKGLNDYGANP